ncbi:DNA polymerase [Cyclospora cayetanensis]|uniref:DNA polymerase n=1 Tax=Cyclospora cayetanensis TaxID=88456 RepID=A0A1D3D4D2_9EIME|nr:DNA polymerase [Cyclospora cayetanensis]
MGRGLLLVLLLVLHAPFASAICRGYPLPSAVQPLPQGSIQEMRRGDSPRRTCMRDLRPSLRTAGPPAAAAAAAAAFLLLRIPQGLHAFAGSAFSRRLVSCTPRAAPLRAQRGPRGGLAVPRFVDRGPSDEGPPLFSPWRLDGPCTSSPKHTSGYLFPTHTSSSRRSFGATASCSGESTTNPEAESSGGGAPSSRPGPFRLHDRRRSAPACEQALPAACGEPSAPSAPCDTALPSGVRGGGGGPLDSQGPLRRFVVVDGSCVMFRCYHAMPSLKNRDGDNVGAVMGFFRSLVQIRRLLSPSHLAVVFDHPTGRSSRLAISHSYKSHRTHPPLELTEQIQKAKHLCAAMGLLPLEVEGVEGDDVIATLVDRLCTEVSEPQQQQQERRESPVFDEVVVATVDKDLLQASLSDAMLLRYNYQSKGGTPRVSLLALHRQCRLLDRQFVEEEYGVDPHQLLDFFSLVGDRADGIVGCRGIGVAAAKKVLRAVESLEALHASPEKLKKASLRPSQMAALKEFLPQWCTNRRLVALDCGVIPARSRSLTSFELTPVDPGDLKQMFAAYNLSKQADLWIQAGNAAAFSAGGSAASGAHGEIPSPEAAAKSQPYAGFSGAAVSSEAAASLAVVSASAAAKTSPAPAEGTHAADWQGGDATGDTAAEGLSDEGGVDTAAAAAATTGEAEGVPAAWIGNYGNSETAVSQAHAPEAPGVVLCGVHLSAAPQSLLPFRTDASRADAASFAVGTGSTPALPGAPSGRAAAEGAAQNAAWRQSEASPPRGSFAASLLSFWPVLTTPWLLLPGVYGAQVPHRKVLPLSLSRADEKSFSLLLNRHAFSQRRLLFHRAAAPSNSVIGVAGCVYSAAEKASTAAAASPSLQAPFASLLPGSSDGSHALDSARLQDPLPFAFDHEGELLRNGDGQGSNKPAAPGDSASGSAAARRADSDGEADCNMQQAQAFHSTIVLCLRYLAVLQQFEGRRCCDSPFEAAAGVTLGGLLRQIPEPVPMDPLEMSLSIVAKSAATQSTPDVVKISHTCLEGGSKARNRPDTGAPLLPISVAWLASSPLGTHAPASALCPLHLSFSIHLPPGLSRLLADELPQQTPLQQPPLQQTPLQQPQQAVLDILHFHFPVSLLLRDSAAFQMLRDCLRMSGLPPANSGSSDRLKTDDAETAPPRSLSATTPNAHSPRILWAAHNAKQLLHLLLNIGLVPPANRQLHCTSVLSWLLHGANSRNSDLLQHAVERPLIPTLVAVERRGLSLSTPILTDGWRANRGVALHAPETPDAADGAAGSVLDALPADLPQSRAFTPPPSEGEPATTPQTPPGDFGEALQEQRILEQHIWRLIHQLTGRTNVNINSPSQLAEILFDVLQLSPPPSTRAGSVSSLTEKTPSSQGGTKSNPCNTGGRSTGAEALQALLREALSKKLDARSAQVAALLSALLKYRASHKFVSTYFASLPSYIFPLTHRIHFSLLQTGAATGRLACRNPNLQNIPNHQEEWRWIRRAFVPSAVNPCKADEATVRGDALTSSLTAMLLGASREDGSPMPAADAVRVPPSSPWRFLSIDYSQMELHILAYLSNDPQLLNDLSGGISSGETGRRYDSFQLTASRLFGCPPEDVTKERRSAAKTVTYGILYGQTEGGLSRQLRAPLKDARHLINCFFNEYKGVRALMHTHTQFAEATGTIETLIGRSRRLDGTDVVSLQLKQHAELGQLLQRIGAAKKPLPQQVGIATSTGSSTKNRCRRQAMNTPIQGLAADIMKYVTGRVDELLKRQQQRAFDHEDMLRASTLRGSVGGIPNLPPHYQALRRPLRAQVVLQIHDELLLEVHKEDISLTLELVLPLMQRAWGLLLVETNCLDRYAALCQVQRRLIDPLGHNDTDHESALASAGNGSNVAKQEIWFSLPDQYEWLRPFLQRKLPTSAKSGRDWACC